MRRNDLLHAALVALTTLSGGQIATASEYGCTVLLCLANPNGPEAVTECINPIRQLRRDLERGRGFPSCEEANDNNGTRVQFSSTRYDPCPAGTAPLAEGDYAVLQGSPNGDLYRGIGDGANALPSGDEVRTYPPKTCVGNRAGTVAMNIGAADAPSQIEATLYDQVVQLPASDGSSIDVYVQNQLYRRVQLK